MELDEDENPDVSVGDVVAGKYVVEHVLGVGGMATVLAARHVELDEHFALKFLSREFASRPEVVERFTREAKAACKLRSEHVARVYDVGTHAGAPFLVMEHLVGRDLGAVVADSGALPIEDAVEYTMQACEALAAAHSNGIVHRDIKPENLFLVEQESLPVVKLLDFGISKVALAGGDAVSRLTGELSMGTPCYMSPEQIRSTASADALSDQWSLGVVLYELLTATQAFQAESVTELCAAVLEQDARPLREIAPHVPQGLADVVARCMEKDPARRFGDVAELAAALLPFAPTRALVSAERSSSIMAGERRVSGRQRISPVPPSLAPSSVTPSSLPSSTDASSGPPVVADVRPADLRERQPRRWGRVVLLAVVTAAAVGIALPAYRMRVHGTFASETRPISATPDALVPTATATATVTAPVTATATAGAATTARVESAITMTSAVQKRPSAPLTAPPQPASLQSARARKGAPSGSVGSRPSASAPGGPAPADHPASPATARVELGY